MELARTAVETDHAACARLVEAALLQAAAMRGGTALVGRTTADELLDGWVAEHSDESSALFVGEFEGAVVGLLAVVAAVADGGRRGRIECCFVEKEARGVGVGTALMDAAVSWCEGAGCKEVDALALPGDRSTKQRLEAAGFTARLLTLSRRLR